MARSTWDGFLKLSLISIPVRAYNSAARDRGEIRFHQIHKGCGARIQYKKLCPVHGEVTKDEIVSGYEVEKGEYAEVEKEELKKLRAEDEEAINIEAFTPPGEVELLYHSGKSFYLVPEGPAGQKPYALLHRVMNEKNVEAIAQMVLSGHEETVLIRPVGKLLAMTVLFYESQVKSPESFEEEVSEPKLSAQELKLASTLVEASTVEEFDFSRFKDVYTERVASLLEAKADGKAVRAPKKEKVPGVINLMDALKKSLQHTRKKGGEPHPRRRKTG
jgi:DNA end-binding protein Ku